MRGKYIVAAAVVAALAGGCRGRAPDTSPPARALSALEILQKDIAYIAEQQRAGNSYGGNRKEHSVPGGILITDGFTMPAPVGGSSATFGTSVSPCIDGLERIVFIDGNIAVVDWENNGRADRLMVMASPYDPRNPNLDPDLARNTHPGGNFPQDVADKYLAVLATVVASKVRTGEVDRLAAMKYAFARKAVLEALNPPAP
jgi:hypothetical protein